jgi:predicted transcriptional regulator
VTLPPDVDARLREVAARRGQSYSAVVADAIRSLPDPSDQLARVLALAGTIRGGGPESLGRVVDDILYPSERDRRG